MTELLFLLLLLACPLAMFFMMRGGHGHHGGHSAARSPSGSEDERVSVAELRRRRVELGRLIEERERAEAAGAGDERTHLRPRRPAVDREPAGAGSAR